MEVRLETAALSDKPALHALLQRYIAEFTAFEPVEPDENGVYPYYYFDASGRIATATPISSPWTGRGRGSC